MLIEQMSPLPRGVSALPLGIAPVTCRGPRGQSRSLSSATRASAIPYPDSHYLTVMGVRAARGWEGQTGIFFVKKRSP